jgi:carboxyl-terminal processing protease
MKKGKVFWPVVFVLISVLCIFCLNKSMVLNADTMKIYPQLEKFTDCLEKIQKYYVEEVPPEKLIEGAIKGMTSVLDPHSAYLTKEGYKEMQISTTGSFGGLGIEIGIRDSVLTVITPIEGTPAFEAKILPGDMILKIDDKSTAEMTLEDAVKLLRGPKGTKVTLTILRNPKEKPFDVTITRAIIHIESVKAMLLEPGYGYIRVRQFQVDTTEVIRKALTETAPNLKGLVLDLRFDPGGLLGQAIEVSDLFLGEGKIVYTDGRSSEDRKEYIAHKAGTFEGFPMVVLINGGTASAAEIVAGALQDNKRAVVLGTKSFGKASVQTIIPLSDGSALKLTVARYFTPSGRSIQATGITPDIVVEQATPPETGNGQKFLREKDLKQHLEPADKNEAKKDDKVAQMLRDDNQLKYGLDLLKTWQVFSKKNKPT